VIAILSLHKIQLNRADLGAGNGIGNSEEASTMKFVQFIKNFVREEDGVTAIEYGLIAALVAVGIIVGATALGTELNALFNQIAGVLAGV
jgi:pilus assembly protein Flp/PilA